MQNNQENQINQSLQQNQVASQFGVSPVPFHTHNGSDSNKIAPQQSLNGWPVVTVPDASVTPSDNPVQGVFKFQVDSTPKYYEWIGILNPSTNKVEWKGFSISSLGVLNEKVVALPSHVNSGGTYQTYTDTISCSFTPKIVQFNGMFSSPVSGNTYVLTNGSGDSSLQGSNAIQFSAGSFGGISTSASYIGIGYGSSYVQVTTWGASSIVVTQYVYGFGSGSSTFSGTLTILG